MPGDKLSKAMILAAGFGTRLKPLTDTIPKPLVTYKNIPMIEIVINRLIESGIKDITINTHYLNHKIEEYLSGKKFSVKINLINEPEILGTGGGIKNSEKYLKGSGSFLVHNVDVISEIDLSDMFEFHLRSEALSTLAVKQRETSRPLLVDSENQLCGRISGSKEYLYSENRVKGKTSFTGVYILSDKVFELFPGENYFDIVLFLLDMVKSGEKIICYDIGNTSWKDIGRIENLNA